MKKKQKIHESEEIYLDLTKTYLVPMSIRDGDQRVESVQEIAITRTPKDDIICKKEGYNSKYFYAFYFKYLLDTGYIKIKK